ncbi:MAG TPA: dihydroorotate dehydrogenase-like protein [Thermoleophilaceae bacterium]|nr:dihydroorotate dehydrogenase-like protein [Thermoleophilaceae bacterium]
MSRLATSYLGLELRSPLVASPSPFTRQLESAQRLQESGAAAIVLPSLFEEELVHEEVELSQVLEQGTGSFAESLDYFPAIDTFESTADRYLTTIAAMKETLDVPVIASLNGTSVGGWVRYARLIEEAGADALELNLYRLAADPARSGSAMEEGDLEVVRQVRASTSLAVAVKLSPYYSALAGFALAVVDAGANGLVLFNRFYQPDLDADTREVVPRLELSRPWELRLPLRWIAILRPHLAGRASLAASSGVSSGVDAAKALLVGADVAMMTSAVLRKGREHFATVEKELVAWMDANEYTSVAELRGSVSYAASEDPSAFERANYLKILRSWNAASP